MTASDQAMLARITPEIGGEKQPLPLPTLCSPCQHQLRMAFRNERSLYNGKCALCTSDIITLFALEKNFTVYCQTCWWGDQWDALSYGREFDFSRSFTEQFKELNNAVPKIALLNWRGENSAYCNMTFQNKNCYLIFGGDFNQDCYYGTLCMHNENSLDLNFSDENRLCYALQDSHNCYDSMFLVDCKNVSSSAFCSDCVNCSECILCTNLVNKSYCIENVQYSKEEYLRRKQALLNGKYSTWKLMEQRFAALRSDRIVKYAHVTASEDCTGDYIKHSKMCLNAYDVQDSRDMSDLVFGMKSTDCLSASLLGEGSELCYNSISTLKSSRIVGCLYMIESSNMLYSYNCSVCQDCFGCAGLTKKQYCIFNKQYTKEEYETLVPKIIEHMRNILSSPHRREGRASPGLDPGVRGENPLISNSSPRRGEESMEWGEFFHPSVALFGYNESYAMTNYPIGRAEALERGFNWSDAVSPVPQTENIVAASRLPDSIFDIPDSIIGYTIECEVTRKPFRIIPQELRFYREHNLPLPRRHPDVRNTDRLAFRNPRHLYDRPCMSCLRPMTTIYSPDRKEKVYCEECYMKAVY